MKSWKNHINNRLYDIEYDRNTQIGGFMKLELIFTFLPDFKTIAIFNWICNLTLQKCTVLEILIMENNFTDVFLTSARIHLVLSAIRVLLRGFHPDAMYTDAVKIRALPEYHQNSFTLNIYKQDDFNHTRVLYAN